MISLAACITGFLLDLILGDPVWNYHPVRLIGSLITIIETGIRKVFKHSNRALFWGGLLLCTIVISTSMAIPFAILYIANQISAYLGYVIESIMCYQLFATKALKQESMKIFYKLKEGDLEGARKAVAMIVGRDTKSLTEEGVIKATVETIAENTSDGVIAPLVFMLMGGAPLGFFYKAINTMDSMIGYKNPQYLYFGRVAAKLDDLCNYIPARIAAIFMILGAGLTKMDVQNAYRIFKRDRYNHASPNSAQTEAVCAGALRIQLAGNAYYFGELHEKPFIGEPLQPIKHCDIKKANTLLYVTSFIAVVVLGMIKIGIIIAVESI